VRGLKGRKRLMMGKEEKSELGKGTGMMSKH
jgi:hypothetical protein